MNEHRDIIARAAHDKLLRLCDAPPAPGLYLVATPIGNLADISLRALALLAAADAIYCEDTRHSRRLLAHYAIRTPLHRYDDHASAKDRTRLLDRIADGAAIALISDAGMPLISDPGFKLVREARARALPVTCLPGANAALTGLVLSALPATPFLFEGFLPNRQAARRARLRELAAVPGALVFYEAANRVAACLADMADLWPERTGAVLRELTKRFEEVITAPLPALAARFARGGDGNGEVVARGEFVLLCGPPPAPPAPDTEIVQQTLRTQLAKASLRDAVQATSTQFALPRKQVYKLALELQKAAHDTGKPEGKK